MNLRVRVLDRGLGYVNAERWLITWDRIAGHCCWLVVGHLVSYLLCIRTKQWVLRNWEENTYKKVQTAFDVPYDQAAGPSKIPVAAPKMQPNVIAIEIMVELDFAWT